MSPLQRALTQLNDERARPARLGVVSETVALRKQARRHVRGSGAAKAIMRAAPGRPDPA